jgi:hypothetical protein
MTLTNMSELAESKLGPKGRLLTIDKGLYLEKYPNNVIAFNTNVIIGGYIVWSGDLDITESIDDLKELASKTESAVHVRHKLAGIFNGSQASLPPALLVIDEYKIIYLDGNGKSRLIQDGIPYVKPIEPQART